MCHRVVVELPSVHGSHVDALDAVHRVRMLEQDRRARRGHDGTSCEGAHRPDRHRDRAGGVADVRLAEQQARLEAVRPHRRLQTGEPLGSQGAFVDPRVDHAPQRTQRDSTSCIRLVSDVIASFLMADPASTRTTGLMLPSVSFSTSVPEPCGVSVYSCWYQASFLPSWCWISRIVNAVDG